MGAEDDDLLVTPDILPLDASFAAVRRAVEREREHHDQGRGGVPLRLANHFPRLRRVAHRRRPKRPCVWQASVSDL